MTWEFVPFERFDARGSLLVAALPTSGLVGPVAAGFLAKHLTMRIVGGFQSLDMPPVATVRNGVVAGPVQLWAAEIACGPDGRCDKLLVLKADVAPPVELLMPLADAVMEWASRAGVGLVVGLESYPAESADKLNPVRVATSIAGKDLVRNVKAKTIDESILMGFTAALLLRANREDFPAISLFAPVSEKENEAAIAAGLLGIVDPLLPHIELRPEELLKASEEVAVALAAEREESARQARRLQDQVDMSYV